MFAIPNLAASLFSIKQLAAVPFSGRITAVAKFDDEAEELLEAGVHSVYNIYAEAGSGYAAHVSQTL
jgi:hypothetical protein